MRALDETLALQLIERGSGLAPLDRAVLLAATLGAMPPAEAADWPVDRRDRLLIDARIEAFGTQIGFFARCPHCGEGHEGDFDLGVLPEAVADDAAPATVQGDSIVLRSPTSRAIAGAVRSGQTTGLLHAITDSREHVEDPAWIAEVEGALARAFPLLDVRLDLACHACETGFATRFDIATWLWREVEAIAHRAIDAVDRLARAYGWSEKQVLALGAGRRALYLAKVTA